MEKVALLAVLEEAATVKSQEVISGLAQRKLAELEFHDADRDKTRKASLTTDEYEKTYGNRKYYSTVRASRDYVNQWIRDHSPGKIVLDFACGQGESTCEAAEAGADLAMGLDISPVSIENCRREAATRGLEGNTFFLQGDCENTGLPDDSIDTVICSGVLHHLDLSYTFPELRRIMKPGGMCLCIEALNYNPIIKLYRKLTPEMRTKWEREHILSLADVTFAKRFFDVKEVRYWHLMSILATPLRATALLQPALTLADAIDWLILKIPPISYMAWMFTFVLVKREDP